MIPSFDSEIRSRLSEALSGALGTTIDESKVRLPARAADASIRPPQGSDPALALSADFGLLYGVEFVQTVRVVNGWLLFDFSPAFFSALVERVCAGLPLPTNDGENHTVNRMLALARQDGSGCPDQRDMHRALLYAVSAHKSPGAQQNAERAAQTLFHAISPRERIALLPRCGALGGALARLLSARR